MLNKAKPLGRLLLSLAIALAFGYGFYGLFTYALPLAKDNFREARTSIVADQTEILLNGAAKAYDEGNLDETVRVLELELEILIDKSGRYNLANRWKLERVYFLLGKAYQKQEKFDKAVQNYEDTLRMNPNHLPAKYNLEMIQSGGNGGEGGKKPQQGKPQHKI
jgi:tetratricopeptide (TPR) repeat protein